MVYMIVWGNTHSSVESVGDGITLDIFIFLICSLVERGHFYKEYPLLRIISA